MPHIDARSLDGSAITLERAAVDALAASMRGGCVLGDVDRETHLFRIGFQIMAGAVAWRGTDAPAVLEMYRRLVADAPPTFTCVAALRRAPPAPWLPKEVHGTPIVALFVCDTGPPDEAQARAAALTSFGTPVGNVLQPRPYLQQQTILDATQPNGRRYYWKSEYLPGVEHGLLDACLESLARVPSPHSAILVFPLDGSLNALDEDHSAVGNRGTKAVVNIAAAWDDPTDDDANIGWARATWGVNKNTAPSDTTHPGRG